MTRTATEAARLLAEGKLTAEALLDEYGQRIAEREPAVGAWEHLDPHAVSAARELDRGPKRGPLHGIPIAVKDIIDVAGLPARYGTPIYARNVAAADAACVALAKSAGALVMGKTVTTELAWFHPGKTRNPHRSTHAPGESSSGNAEHTPGGSSSGSAAAVAAGMVPLAFGTQTAGSIIRPAAYCGIVGFKPTFGAIPRAGVKSQSESLDTLGWMANSVEDIALMAAALWRDERFLDTTRGDAVAPRITLLRLPEWNQASAPMQEATQSALQILGAKGAVVSELDAPVEFAALNASQACIQLYEAARSYHPEYSQHRERLSDRIAGLIEEGLAITEERYFAAQDHAAQCRALVAEVFRDTDALLMPGAPGAAPQGLAATGDPVFSRMTTVLHLPCITLPRFKDAAGMPLGIQLAGPARGDRRLLGIARWAHERLHNA